jgi:hypothetical protein
MKDDAKVNAKTEHKAKEIWRKWREKSVLDVLIYICGILVVIGGLWLGYLGVSGHLNSQKVLGLWILYGTLFFVLTGAFLYFQKSIWEGQVTAAPQPNGPLVDLEKSSRDRAYVVLSSAYLAEPPNTGNPPVAKLEFENTGKTPAVNVRISANFARLRSKGREQAEQGIMPKIPQNPFQSIAVIGSGKIADFVTPHQNWSSEEARELTMKGEFVQYVWGELYYDDIFGGKHITHFCVKGEGPDTHRLNFCLHGNSMEDTEKEPDRTNPN